MFTSVLCFAVSFLLMTSLTTQLCPADKLLTFNAGLNPSVKQYHVRKPLVLEALESRTDVDVMCLQEIWFENDLKDLLDGLETTFPYATSFIHHATSSLRQKSSSVFSWFFGGFTTAPCMSKTTIPFTACAFKHCTGLQKIAALGCVIQKCTRQLENIPQDCITCMIMSSTSVWTALGKCANPFNHYNRMNLQGLVLLSKYPITNVQLTLFTPGVKQLLPRGYITADVSGLGKVVCTHLTANMNIPYIEWNKDELRANSWEEQQLNEINRLHEELNNENHILMGDLNTGPVINKPGLEPIVGEFPANFEILLNDNYMSLYESQDGRCTWCKDNVLHNQYSQNKILDHVLLKGFSGRNATRTLGFLKGQQLSDHYGETLNVCR